MRGQTLPIKNIAKNPSVTVTVKSPPSKGSAAELLARRTSPLISQCVDQSSELHQHDALGRNMSEETSEQIGGAKRRLDIHFSAQEQSFDENGVSTSWPGRRPPPVFTTPIYNSITFENNSIRRGGVGDNEHSKFLDSDTEEIPCSNVVTYPTTPLSASSTASVYFETFVPEFSLHLNPFATAIGKTPRMQYLIQYYAEVISPVIVAFDGPSNPFRKHILRLASESETLQHAVSALAASNIRQRRETGRSTGKTDPARRSSMAHASLTHESRQQEHGILTVQDQIREETFHKGFSIRSLNAQLADPRLRMHDSTLATLLMLCLFHICNSGIANFQTQFAGVRKLLDMRSNILDAHIASSETNKWFIRMFTWFDAMTATVNDREGQIKGIYIENLGMTPSPKEQWILENLSGCDTSLFHILAKLGRLNVLSQSKEVESAPTVVCSPLVEHYYSGIDGNGWLGMQADESFFSSQVNAAAGTETLFWREWRESRQALQSWHIEKSISSPELLPSLTFEQRSDISNISESFRYAALVYTERLANPSALSEDHNIQNWVQHALYYIRLVKSDVYLLWPLFIVGSECIREEDRSIIRERCLDIQKDSGFLNNYSCLELLEKVWVENSASRASAEVSTPITGLRFRSIMDRESSGGEYIVV